MMNLSIWWTIFQSIIIPKQCGHDDEYQMKQNINEYFFLQNLHDKISNQLSKI